MEDNQSARPSGSHPGNQPDEYVRCPYFPEHELRRSRLPYHLMKCQKNPAAPKLVACPFNYLHRVRLEERRDHAIICEDRIYSKYIEKDPPSYASTRKQVYGFRGSQAPPAPTLPTSDKTEDGEEWW